MLVALITLLSLLIRRCDSFSVSLVRTDDSIDSPLFYIKEGSEIKEGCNRVYLPERPIKSIRVRTVAAYDGTTVPKFLIFYLRQSNRDPCESAASRLMIRFYSVLDAEQIVDLDILQERLQTEFGSNMDWTSPENQIFKPFFYWKSTKRITRSADFKDAGKNLKPGDLAFKMQYGWAIISNVVQVYKPMLPSLQTGEADSSYEPLVFDSPREVRYDLFNKELGAGNSANLGTLIRYNFVGTRDFTNDQLNLQFPQASEPISENTYTPNEEGSNNGLLGVQTERSKNDDEMIRDAEALLAFIEGNRESKQKGRPRSGAESNFASLQFPPIDQTRSRQLPGPNGSRFQQDLVYTDTLRLPDPGADPRQGGKVEPNQKIEVGQNDQNVDSSSRLKLEPNENIEIKQSNQNAGDTSGLKLETESVDFQNENLIDFNGPTDLPGLFSVGDNRQLYRDALRALRNTQTQQNLADLESNIALRYLLPALENAGKMQEFFELQDEILRLFGDGHENGY